MSFYFKVGQVGAIGGYDQTSHFRKFRLISACAYETNNICSGVNCVSPGNLGSDP